MGCLDVQTSILRAEMNSATVRCGSLAAGFAEVRIAVCVKDVAANEIPRAVPTRVFGCKVVVCCETSFEDTVAAVPVKKVPYPTNGDIRERLPVAMVQAKHGRAHRERTIDSYVSPERPARWPVPSPGRSRPQHRRNV